MVQDITPSAQEVAKMLIRLADDDSEYKHDGLTNLQLQKLLYYVQGWHLGRFDQPLFREPIRAWKFGPVVEGVYHQYKQYDDKFIPADGVAAQLSPLAEAFIASIWDDYKKYSASELVDKAHREQPWLRAREGFRPEDPSNEPMPEWTIREFFSQPSINHMTPEQLSAIAQDPRNAPTDAWFSQQNLTGG